MGEQERRGVSLGTVFMLLLTLVVLSACGIVMPQLMGNVNIRMDEGAMRSSTNLNEALPELVMSDIPLTDPNAASYLPVATEVPLPTEAPVAPAAATAAPVTAPAEQPVSASVVLTFGGSINVDDYIRKSGFYSDTDKYDYTETLALIAGELDSDLTMVTLETITDPAGNVRTIPNAPVEVMGMLSAANVDMVALGYNRAFERGMEGAASTIAQANANGLTTLGLYDSQEDANQFRIMDVNGVQVAYLHYTTGITTTAKRRLNSDNAAYALPMVSVNDGVEDIASDIRAVRAMGAQVVVVSINWSGQDTITTTTTKMKNFMQGLADAGADIIIGAGTKTVKEVSWIVGKREDGSAHQTLCAWSLGSLLNGERNNGNVAGMLLHVQLSVSGSNVNFELVSYTPTYIWRYKQDGQYQYRVAVSDQPVPDGMGDEQAGYMEKAYRNLQKYLGDSPVTLRQR